MLHLTKSIKFGSSIVFLFFIFFTLFYLLQYDVIISWLFEFEGINFLSVATCPLLRYPVLSTNMPQTNAS